MKKLNCNSNDQKNLSDFIQAIDKLYDRYERIGRGNFGVVYRAVRKSDGFQVAIKFLQNVDVDGFQKRLIRELCILASVNHPSCLNLIGYNLSPYQIVTPFMSHGNLQTVLQQGDTNKEFTVTKKMCAIYGLCNVLAYLHSKAIIHRDIKPDNIFLNDDYEIVLSDFGLSRCVQENIDITKASQGSALFMAPELDSNNPSTLTNALDIYSLGVTLLMFFGLFYPHLDDGMNPPINSDEFKHRIRKGARLSRPSTPIPDRYWELYQRCTNGDPKQRPSAQELAEWFKNDPNLLLTGVNIHEYQEYIEKVRYDE